MTPIQLLRTLFHFHDSDTVDDYQMITIIYEEYVRMTIEFNQKQQESIKR